ncbi:hypothetical protein J2TS6_42460 [Paenibacillus albilobatus]|uniref:Uncharacterized protein n=1 Tax=Paenibacillus albilobatus TaxID=2716884 RepID=A0A919XLQ4_9BACL|nr:hypothetical protein [Paenibacillus albilobatus]GIO33105.1 hypothetical protein J2TS6_42460 [Paenibacillus albilobatus]
MSGEGLYKKYTVINNDTGKEVEGEYFILKPENDPAARAALIHYAVNSDNKQLGEDIILWVSKFI